MKTLQLHDLALTTELDAAAMAAVHGGTGKGYPAAWGPLASYTKNDFSFDATQQLSQQQNTLVNNGNNAAFVCGIDATVQPHQTGSNTINFGK